MIGLYQMIVRSLNPPAPSSAIGLMSNDSWRFCIGYELELSESLSLELEAGEPQERRYREADRALEVYYEPRHGSGQFHFELRGVMNFDKRRISTINAILRVCPHASLALLGVLLEAEVIGDEIPQKLNDRQQKRIAQRDPTEFVFALNVTAVEPGARTRLFNTLMVVLQFDDDRIALEAMFIEFPESRTSRWSADTNSDTSVVISLFRNYVIS